MIIPVIATLLVLSVPLTGGRLGRLTDLRLRHGWLVALALVVQVLITAVLVEQVTAFVGAVLHIVTYVMAFLFFWLNRQISGLWIVGSGGAMNFAAISANGGTMPARPIAVELSGLTTATEFRNSGVVEDPSLWVLGDIFAIPDGLPLANVFSIGDVVLLAGLGILLHRACRPGARRPGARRPGARRPGASRRSTPAVRVGEGSVPAVL